MGDLHINWAQFENLTFTKSLSQIPNTIFSNFDQKVCKFGQFRTSRSKKNNLYLFGTLFWIGERDQTPL